MKKAMLAIFVAILSQSSFAAGDKGDDISRHKERMLTDLRARAAMINTKISCIQAASTQEAVKACHERGRAEEEAFNERRRSEEKTEMMASEEKRRADFDKRMRDMEEKRQNEKNKSPR